MIPIFRNIILILLWIVQISLYAQTNSPLSTAESGRNLGFNFGPSLLMGAGSAAYNTPNVINSLNPASYTSTNLTNIDFGIIGEGLSATIADTNVSSGRIGLSHLSFSMPIVNNKMGIAFGIHRNYSTSYSYSGTASDTNFGQIKRKLYGEGNMYNIFLGTGYKYKNLSLGANIRFEFGNIKQNTELVFADSLVLPSSKSQIDKSFFNIQYNLGAQYQHFINKKSNLVFGAYYLSDLSNSISQIARTYSNIQSGSSIFPNETSSINTQPTFGKYSQFGMGINYTNYYTTTYGLEFERRDFSNRKANLSEEYLQSAWSIGLGIEYKPILSPTSDTRKFFQRAIYRFGVNAGKSEFQVGSGVNEFKIKGGVSMPVLSRNISYITLGLEWHQIGFESKLIQESYLRFFAQFTFSDRWFIRSKFD